MRKKPKSNPHGNATERRVARAAVDAARPRALIKFQNGALGSLRNRLLEDLSREHFAVLLGKFEATSSHVIINVYDVRYPDSSDYADQSLGFLRLRKEYIHRILVELTHRYDVDSIIDVHTHPFSRGDVAFSTTDDHDEEDFCRFLNDKFDNLHYASIVFSQTEYSARLWETQRGLISPQYAVIKTQTRPELISSSDERKPRASQDTREDLTGVFDRSALALGLETMRQIMDRQVISVVGVGGLGSVIAEHLVHMGFQTINLIDPDRLELSNLNRIVGAYYADAVMSDYKVDVVRRHLEKINPRAFVSALAKDIADPSVESAIAPSDWIVVATDNHSSRFHAQRLSIKYFVPMISAGVNITVNDDKIEDMSGDVILARVGDNLCLNCLRRLNPTKIANETHPDKTVREQLVQRGYVTGSQIKEPAVKTLNTILATMAVDTLINQFTGRQIVPPVLVYEDNQYRAIYEDYQSVNGRIKSCATCNLGMTL
jgi:molybdopterin/thiamine biosynthesis adenylyltransferase